jgi:hypothetical protein
LVALLVFVLFSGKEGTPWLVVKIKDFITIGAGIEPKPGSGQVSNAGQPQNVPSQSTIQPKYNSDIQVNGDTRVPGTIKPTLKEFRPEQISFFKSYIGVIDAQIEYGYLVVILEVDNRSTNEMVLSRFSLVNPLRTALSFDWYPSDKTNRVPSNSKKRIGPLKFKVDEIISGQYSFQLNIMGSLDWAGIDTVRIPFYIKYE